MPENPILAIVGTDPGEVRRSAREAAARMTPEDAGEFGIDTIDGNAETVDEAVQRIHDANNALNTLGFFGGGKLVWLKNATFLADNVVGRSDHVKDALDHLANTLSAGLPDNVRFLISAHGIDKRKNFAKKLAKLATMKTCDKLDTSKSGWEGQLAAIARKKAKELNFQFAPDALDLFVALSSGDSQQVEGDLEKIGLFLDQEKRTATANVVRMLVSESRAGVIWVISDAISRRDARSALHQVDAFLRRGESAIGILLAAIVPTIRNLLHAKELMVTHKLKAPSKPFHFSSHLDRLPKDATSHLPRKKDGSLNAYPLGIAACNAHRYSLHELHSALNACLNANLELVSTSIAHNVVLSKLILQITAKSSPPSPAHSSHASA